MTVFFCLSVVINQFIVLITKYQKILTNVTCSSQDLCIVPFCVCVVENYGCRFWGQISYTVHSTGGLCLFIIHKHPSGLFVLKNENTFHWNTLKNRTGLEVVIYQCSHYRGGLKWAAANTLFLGFYQTCDLFMVNNILAYTKIIHRINIAEIFGLCSARLAVKRQTLSLHLLVCGALHMVLKLSHIKHVLWFICELLQPEWV